MSQFGRPASNITQTGFTGGFAEIDEAVASDTDFAWGANGGANTLEVLLSSVTDPQSSIGHIVRYRLAKTNAGTLASTGNAVTVDVSLMQGATVIHTQSAIAISGTWAAGTFTLTTTETDSITDYTDLRIRVTDSTNGGTPGNRRGGAISWAEFETPNAPAGVNGTATVTGTAATMAMGTVTAVVDVTATATGTPATTANEVAVGRGDGVPVVAGTSAATAMGTVLSSADASTVSSGTAISIVSGTVTATGTATAGATGASLAVALANVTAQTSSSATASAVGSDLTSATGTVIVSVAVSISVSGVDATTVSESVLTSGDANAGITGVAATTNDGTALATGVLHALAYDAGSLGLMNRSIDWSAGPISLLLVTSSYVPTQGEADLTTAAAKELSTYGGARRTLVNCAIANDATNNRVVYDADDPTAWTTTAGDTIGGAVIYKVGATDALSIPIFYVPVAATPTTTGSVRLQFDSTGIIYLGS